MQHENPFPQTGNEIVDGADIRAAGGGGQPVHQALFVEAGL